MITDLVLMKITKIIQCRCGSKNCCGYIVREGSRWRIKKKRNQKKIAILNFI